MKRYIPEHQNKLNIYDLPNYEFFTNFFSNSLYFTNEKNSENSNSRSMVALICNRLLFAKMPEKLHFSVALLQNSRSFYGLSVRGNGTDIRVS